MDDGHRVIGAAQAAFLLGKHEDHILECEEP